MIKTGKEGNKVNTIKQIREDYKTIFNNEKYWNTLRVAIALNKDLKIPLLQN